MSRRNIVVFYLPHGELAYLELGDLVNKPLAGELFTLEGKRYQATEVVESIGERKADGTPRSGMDKLLEVLALRFEKEAIALLARLRNIGSGDQPKTGPAGIILPDSNLIGDFDHVVFVSLKDLGGKKASGPLLGQLHTFATGRTATPDPVDEAPGLSPIKVDDAAAG